MNRNKAVGYGYVGRWLDGSLGWCMPEFLSRYKSSPEFPRRTNYNEGEPTYRCKITVEILPGKNGKPVMRRIKSATPGEGK